MEEEILRAALIHVKAATSVLTSMKKFPCNRLPAKRLYPANINSEKQCKFFSTKKKSRLSMSLSKPSYNTIVECKNTLRKYVPRHCGVCLQEDDKASTEIIKWVQCSQCELWLHTSCTSGASLDGSFLCHLCC